MFFLVFLFYRDSETIIISHKFVFTRQYVRLDYHVTQFTFQFLFALFFFFIFLSFFYFLLHPRLTFTNDGSHSSCHNLFFSLHLKRINLHLLLISLSCSVSVSSKKKNFLGGINSWVSTGGNTTTIDCYNHEKRYFIYSICMNLKKKKSN